MEVGHHAFLTSVKDWDRQLASQLRRPSFFTNHTGNWVGPIASLDAVQKRIILFFLLESEIEHTFLDIPIHSLVAAATEQYQLPQQK